MKTKIIAFTFLASLLTISCSEDRNALASAEYVKIAQTSADAKKMFVNSEFDKALEAFKKIDSDIQTLVNQYPETAIALRLVSEENIMVGSFRYKDISSRIIPKLTNITNPRIKPISRTWAIAAFDKNWQEAFQTLHGIVVKDSRFTQEMKDEIIKNSPISVSENNSNKIVEKPQQKKAVEKVKTLSADEMKKLLAEAKQNARYCAFELKASEALLKKSSFITEKYRKDFSEILKDALKRSEQISVGKLREKAFANLAVAAAKIEDEALAMSTIAKINNPDSFEKVFVELASTIGRTKNYPTALAIAAKIKTQSTKDNFLSQLASNVAQQGKTDTAIEIAKQISNIPLRNSTICKIASAEFTAKNYKGFISAITNIDISSLDCLSEFFSFEALPPAERTVPASVAVLAKMTVPLNQKLATYLTNLAIEKYNGGFTTAKIIADNLLALKEYKKATDFVRTKTFHKLTREESFALLTYVAVGGLDFEKAEALKTLKDLVLRSKVESTPTRIFIAYEIEKSKLSGAEISDILKPLLNIE